MGKNRIRSSNTKNSYLDLSLSENFPDKEKSIVGADSTVKIYVGEVVENDPAQLVIFTKEPSFDNGFREKDDSGFLFFNI